MARRTQGRDRPPPASRRVLGCAQIHAGLSSRQDADPLQFRLDDANRRIGELSMEVELLRIKAARALPFPARRSLK
jgi:hypothetical protein